MSFKACPKCNHLVSDTAFACPSCGHPLKKAKAQSNPSMGCLWIFICIIGFIVWASAGGKKQGTEQQATNTSSTDNSSQQAAAPENTTPAAPTCQSDWSACADNSDLANNNTKAMAYATVACKEGVNQRAKYGDPKWCSGFLCQDFTKFQPGSDAPKTGLLTIIDDKVQMQNGFGAWAHVTVRCTYNLKTDQIENLLVNEQE